MTLQEAHYKGNSNIGFYGILNEEYAIFAHEFKRADMFDHAVELTMGNTQLVGLFLAGNANAVLVPDIATDHEIERLDELGITYHVFESRYTVLGNLILCNDHGAVISPHLEHRAEEISELLEVPVAVSTVAGLDLPGSCGIATNNGVLLHREATEEELETIEDVLDVSGDIGSVNFGSPYIHSGVLANSEIVLVGQETTGPEIQRIQDALGFLD